MAGTDRTTRWFRQPLILWAFVLGFAIVGLLVVTRNSPPETARDARAVRGQSFDEALRSDVSGALRRRGQGLGALQVHAREGVVTLEGPVASAEQRERAVRIARETPGVREVVDRLTVRPSSGEGGDSPP